MSSFPCTLCICVCVFVDIVIVFRRKYMCVCYCFVMINYWRVLHHWTICLSLKPVTKIRG